MLAVHFDNWVFLLLVAMAGLLRLLSKMAGGPPKQSDVEKTAPPPPRSQDTASPRHPTSSDEEQIRKFLEALGQPTTAKPPPPVSPRHDLPPRPVAPVRPPASMFPTPGGVPKSVPPREPKVVLPEKTATRGRRTILPRLQPPLPVEIGQTRVVPAAPLIPEVLSEAYAIPGSPGDTIEAVKGNLGSWLASPSGLRNAIILREILGPPRSLQPLDSSGIV